MEALPDNWADIQPDTVYLSTSSLLVSFASEQIKLGLKYDQKGKHLKAIEKGLVSPRGNVGLVTSQESGYDLKSKPGFLTSEKKMLGLAKFKMI